jgi:hypothetical protein
MNFTSKKTSLIILGVESLLVSRGMFSLFNDPEGPNLLIVVGTAAILYFLSLMPYFFNLSTPGLKRFLLSFSIQIIAATSLYFFLI